MHIRPQRWDTSCRTSIFLMSRLAHLTSSNRKKVRLPKARYSAASGSTHVTTPCSRATDNASAFRLMSQAAFLEATLRSTDWTSKDRNIRSEEHTSELQSQSNLVCRLLLEKNK